MDHGLCEILSTCSIQDSRSMLRMRMDMGSCTGHTMAPINVPTKLTVLREYLVVGYLDPWERVSQSKTIHASNGPQRGLPECKKMLVPLPVGYPNGESFPKPLLVFFVPQERGVILKEILDASVPCLRCVCVCVDLVASALRRGHILHCVASTSRALTGHVISCLWKPWLCVFVECCVTCQNAEFRNGDEMRDR